MNKKSPVISVGMPVYNGETYIDLSIKSILEQSFADFELIISDNASTDNTEEICRNLEKQDDRIIYHRNEKNVGAGNNYNILFHKSRGRYFRWHNADDMIKPEAHKLCLEVLEKNGDIVLSYGKTDIIDDKGSFLRKYDDNLDLQQDSPSERFIYFYSSRGWTNAIYGLMRREAMAKTDLFGNYQASDYNFVAALSLQGKFYEIQKTLFLRRIHPGANTWSPNDKKAQQEFWDPDNKKYNNQLVKQYKHYFKSELKASIPFKEKIKISKFLIKSCYWDKGQLWNDLLTGN